MEKHRSFGKRIDWVPEIHGRKQRLGLEKSCHGQ